MMKEISKLTFILIVLIINVLFIYAQQTLTLETLTTDWSMKVYALKDNGDIIKIPKPLLDGLDSKDTNIIVSTSGNMAVYSYYDWRLNKYVIFIIDVPNSKKTKLINNNEYDYYLEDLSPDDSRVLLCRYNSDVYSLCIVKTDGTGLVELAAVSAESGYCSYAKWLTDTEVVYAIKKGEIQELYLVNANDLRSQLISNTLMAFGDLSKDGNLIFYNENGNNKVGYINVYTGFIVYFDIDPLLSLPRMFYWSPDGEKVMYMFFNGDGNDLMLMDIDTGSKRKMDSLISGSSGCLGWIENGSKFVYVHNNNSTGLGIIYIIDVNTQNKQNFTAREGVYYTLAKACPLLHVYNGLTYENIGEVLSYFQGKANERTEQIILPVSYINNYSFNDYRLEIKIEEVLNEISYLDRVRILVNGEVYKPVDCLPQLEEIDGTYIELKRDDSIILKFTFNEKIKQDIILECTGYYFPFY